MIHLIVETYRDADPKRDAELELCRQSNGSCLDIVPITFLSGKRHTIPELMAHALPDCVNLIANSDIAIPSEACRLIEANLQDQEVFALSRWNVTEGGLQHYNHADSQDCWAWRGMPPELVADFTLGVPGCDNRLAWLFDQAGWKVFNPSLDVRTLHHHRTGVRNYNAEQYRLPPPYLLVPPSTLSQIRHTIHSLNRAVPA